MDMLTIALAKGRLGDKSLKLLSSAGVCREDIIDDSRKLIFHDETNNISFFLVKPADVPTYVEYGAADIGIVGKDTLLEEQRQLFEMMDLGFAKCRLVIAGMPQEHSSSIISANKRVATKYPNIAREHFNKKGETIEVIKLNGSVELAPLVGLAEVILDIVESGRTLQENGLSILEEICDISSRLIVNRASLKTKYNRITEVIEKIKMQMEGDQDDRINKV